MKKILLCILLLVSIPITIFSQEQAKQEASKSKAAIFAAREGSLIKKEFFANSNIYIIFAESNYFI